jgi:hypothetical protein
MMSLPREQRNAVRWLNSPKGARWQKENLRIGSYARYFYCFKNDDCLSLESEDQCGGPDFHYSSPSWFQYMRRVREWHDLTWNPDLTF